MTYFRAFALLGLLLAAFFAAPIRDPIFAQGGGCTLVNYTCQEDDACFDYNGAWGDFNTLTYCNGEYNTSINFCTCVVAVD